MDKHCRICHNISCSNHGKNVLFLGDGWKCNYIPVPTNADRFRAMSNEEQQSFVRGFWEIEDFADWLQQPADGDDHAYLKLCPFCGGEAKLFHPCDGVHLVQCTCCGCGTTYTRTEIGAVRMWNRRVGEVRHVD